MFTFNYDKKCITDLIMLTVARYFNEKSEFYIIYKKNFYENTSRTII